MIHSSHGCGKVLNLAQALTSGPALLTVIDSICYNAVKLVLWVNCLREKTDGLRDDVFRTAPVDLSRKKRSVPVMYAHYSSTAAAVTSMGC